MLDGTGRPTSIRLDRGKPIGPLADFFRNLWFANPVPPRFAPIKHEPMSASRGSRGASLLSAALPFLTRSRILPRVLGSAGYPLADDLAYFSAPSRWDQMHSAQMKWRE
jgi:hypothetical protein